MQDDIGYSGLRHLLASGQSACIGHTRCSVNNNYECAASFVHRLWPRPLQMRAADQIVCIHSQLEHFYKEVAVGDSPSKAKGLILGGGDAWADLPQFSCRSSPALDLGTASLQLVGCPLLVVNFTANAAQTMPPPSLQELKHSESVAICLSCAERPTCPPLPEGGVG